MSGQRERCEREWHELEGEFQELQVRPGHLVPRLGYLSCRTFPFLLPQPGRWAPSGPRGVPGQALEAGGPRGPAPSISQHFSSSPTWGARSKPPFPPPSHRLLAPPSLQKVGLWPPRGSSRRVHVGEACGDRSVLGLGGNSPAPTSSGVSPHPTLRLVAAQLPLCPGEQPSAAALLGRCAWETFTLNPSALLRDWGSRFSAFGALLQADFGVADGIGQF